MKRFRLIFASTHLRFVPIVAGLLMLAASATAQAPPPTLLRQLYGDVAIEVQLLPGSALRVAAADSSRAITLTLIARDVIRWADSATRVLDARLRGKDSTGKWQTVVEEPGMQSGSIAIAKTITGKNTTIAILVSDTDFNQVHFVLDDDEARSFVLALQRTARTAVKPPKRVRPPPR